MTVKDTISIRMKVRFRVKVSVRVRMRVTGGATEGYKSTEWEMADVEYLDYYGFSQ